MARNLRSGLRQSLNAGLAGGFASNDIFTTASLDLNFAKYKNIGSLVTFSRASSGTYVGSDGLIKTATTDAPRFDHDPTTGESLGLLVEESRTNQVYESENVGNVSPWLGPSITKIAGFDAPDGTTNAVQILETITNDGHFTFWNSSSALTTATASVFVKPIDREYLGIRAFKVANNWENVVFNVTGEGSVVNHQSGTSSTYSNVQGFIEKHADGWYRISVTCTNTTGVVLPLVIHTHTTATPTLDSNGEEVFVGDISKGFYAWGAQIESGSFPTSYIRNTTGSSAVTRAADVADSSGSNFSSWYRQDEGTVFTEIIPRQFSQAFGVFSLDNGTTSERFQTRFSTTGSGALVASDGGTVQANFATLNTATTQIRSRLATSYAINSFNACLDGGQIASDASGTLPTPTQGVIGNAVGANYANAPISRITFWPTRLPDETLQTITN